MTGHATTPRSRTTLTGTWLLAMVLVLAPALSDLCAAMCAMPMDASAMPMSTPMSKPTPASDVAGAEHREHHAGAANAAAAHHDIAKRPDSQPWRTGAKPLDTTTTLAAAADRGDAGMQHDATAHRDGATRHDHCGAATATATASASATRANDVPTSPFALRAAHHCVLHGPTAPASADETRALAAVRAGGATHEGLGALEAPPAVTALTFSLAASARSAPLPGFASTSGLASARPLRVPLRI
jgi:hypothetical protein